MMTILASIFISFKFRYILPGKEVSDNTKWYIPINFVTDQTNASSYLPIYWLSNNNEKITISNVFSSSNNSKNFVYLNHNRLGYYRVNYDYPSWVALNDNFHLLPSITRAQLLDDSFYLARAEFLTYDVPLTFLMTLRVLVNDHLLWTSASKGLDFLTYKLNREPAYETFRVIILKVKIEKKVLNIMLFSQALMRFIVRPAFEQYGLNEPDNGSHKMLAHQAVVVEYACRYNYDRCTNAAQLKYREWMRDAKRNL